MELIILNFICFGQSHANWTSAYELGHTQKSKEVEVIVDAKLRVHISNLMEILRKRRK